MWEILWEIKILFEFVGKSSENAFFCGKFLQGNAVQSCGNLAEKVFNGV